MTEIMLADIDKAEAANPAASAEPDPDLERLLCRYVPSQRCQWCAHLDRCKRKAKRRNGHCQRFAWGMTVDRFSDLGVGLIESVRHHAIALGDLAWWGFEVVRPHITWNDEPIESVTRWQIYCAVLWRTSPSTVKKAMRVSTAKANGEIPEDTPDTNVYEVASGLRNGEGLEAAIEEVTGNGYNLWQIRLCKKLRNAGLLPSWTLPGLYVEAGRLWAHLDGRRVELAKLIAVDDDPLALAGRFLLAEGARVTFPTKKQTKTKEVTSVT